MNSIRLFSLYLTVLNKIIITDQYILIIGKVQFPYLQRRIILHSTLTNKIKFKTIHIHVLKILSIVINLLFEFLYIFYQIFGIFASRLIIKNVP